MSDSFQLEIVTPEKMIVRDNAESIQIPGLDGYLGVLPGHAPLITELGAGEIAYRANGESHRYAVAWGFAEVLQDRVTVLAETAELANEIDVPRAQRAFAAAEDSLKSAQTEDDFAHATAKMRVAQARIDVAQNKNSSA